MMHGVFILHTIISSVARNGNTGRTFSQRTLYTIQRISIPPHCHFERSEKSFSSPFSTTPSLSRLREAPPIAFPAIQCFPFPAVKHSPSYRQRKRSRTSLGMTLREYRFLTLPIYFPCNNDTREAPSTFAALLFFMRRTTPLNPTT